MRRIEAYASVRPFLEHEVDACSRLRVPVESAVLVATAEGDADAAFESGSAKGLGQPKRGTGCAAAVDIREHSARFVSDFTNCYWGLPDGMVKGGPPPHTRGMIADDVALPALQEFLSGRDVSVATLGARVSGKTHLLYGDPADETLPAPSDSILAKFAAGLWEAFGGEGADDGVVVAVSAIELLPDGTALDILAECQPVGTCLNDTFVRPIPGWNPLWEVVVSMHYNLATLRNQGTPRGTTLLSLRVERKGAKNTETFPIAAFIEMEPFTPTSNTVVVSAVRRLAAGLENGGSGAAAAAEADEEEGGRAGRDLPWGVRLLLDALQGRSWSSHLIGCVSPSPTALQASVHVLSTLAQFYSPHYSATGGGSGAGAAGAAGAATPNAKRDVTGVLSFTPDGREPSQDHSPQPQPRPEAPPQPTPHKTPQSVLHNTSMDAQTPTALAAAAASVAGGPPQAQAPPSAASSRGTMEESMCSELIGLVKMLKGEVETLRTELAEERQRNSAGKAEVEKQRGSVERIRADHEQLKAEKDALAKELEAKSVEIEMVFADKRNVERELRQREEEKDSLLYEAKGLHKQLQMWCGDNRLSASPSRTLRKDRSRSPMHRRQPPPAGGRPSVGGGHAAYTRQGTHQSMRSNHTAVSSTQPQAPAGPAQTRSHSGGARAEPTRRSRTPPARSGAAPGLERGVGGGGGGGGVVRGARARGASG
eukprot:Rhum_TRINITY_DN25019_c0_g1::Rhum_TRINITY_DN25019_c0_g1_i1::g.180916::m.180916